MFELGENELGSAPTDTVAPEPAAAHKLWSVHVEQKHLFAILSGSNGIYSPYHKKYGSMQPSLMAKL
jgi:hypothetical protein